jgi:AGZA family xanthine/uracil permease-like MFS transporter
MLTITPIAMIDFTNYNKLIPAFLTIVLISFTYNIGVGITAGLQMYPHKHG